VNPTRSYKQSDYTWKVTDSLASDNLLPMAELLREEEVAPRPRKVDVYCATASIR
jgi:hypothetical protein